MNRDSEVRALWLWYNDLQFFCNTYYSKWPDFSIWRVKDRALEAITNIINCLMSISQLSLLVFPVINENYKI